MNTDDLRDALTHAVPGAPEPDGWAARVRRRSRRRRDAGLMAASAMSGVAVAAAATLWSGVGRPGLPAAMATPRTTPAASVTGSRQSGTPAADPCAVIDRAPDTMTWTAVPTGASAVRVCSMEFGVQGTPPADELTESVDVLALAVNSGPRLPTSGACPTDLGTFYTLMFTYPDGSRVLVSGETSGCQPVGGHRGGREVLGTFGRLLEAQRASQPPVTVPPVSGFLTPKNCRPDSWMKPNPVDTVAAWLCYWHPAADRPVVVTVDGWAMIAQAMASGGVPTTSTDYYASNTSVIAISNRGEQVELTAWNQSLFWSVGDAQGKLQQMQWKATAAQWAAIASAHAQAQGQGPPALCGAGPTAGLPLPKAGSIVSMSRCVRTADGVLTEYPLNPKMLGIVSDALVTGTEDFFHCPALPVDQPVDWLETRDADGNRDTLVRECTGMYRAVEAGAQVAWKPTTDARSWLDSLAPR